MNDEALKAAYFAGFNASGEGYNGEYPFGDHVQDPEEDAAWRKNRDNELTAIKQALAAQPAPEQYTALEQALTRLQKRYAELEAKVAAQPAVQEPFGYVYEVYCLPECALEMEWVEGFDRYEPDAKNNIRNVTPVYTTPTAAQPAVQEPVGYVAENGVVDWNVCAPPILTDLYTTQPAAQPAQAQGPYSAPVKELWSVAPKAAAQPAVPDALNPKDENPAYAAGWNDCRQAMLEMMK